MVVKISLLLRFLDFISELQAEVLRRYFLDVYRLYSDQRLLFHTNLTGTSLGSGVLVQDFAGFVRFLKELLLLLVQQIQLRLEVVKVSFEVRKPLSIIDMLVEISDLLSHLLVHLVNLLILLAQLLLEALHLDFHRVVLRLQQLVLNRHLHIGFVHFLLALNI